MSALRRRRTPNPTEERTMAEPETFALADRALARVVAQIAPDQWDMILPSTFVTRSRPEPPPLRTLVNYHAFDDAWVPDTCWPA
jgi:hypothetical protein